MVLLGCTPEPSDPDPDPDNPTPEPPVVAVDPLHEVLAGESVTIGATVTGGDDVQCAWRLDGELLSETCGDLTIEPTTDGVYLLTATDDAGRFDVGAATVRVYQPMTAQIEADLPQYLEGGFVEVTPTLAGGIPPVTCTWTLDTSVLSTDCSWIRFEATDDAQVTLTLTDAAGHTVSAQDEIRVLKATTQAPPPTISLDELTLVGSATGLIGEPECLWEEQGVQINADTDCTVTLVPAESTSLSLTLTDADTDNAVHEELPVEVTPPTCADGVRNLTETDTDCGGLLPQGRINEFMQVNATISGPSGPLQITRLTVETLGAQVASPFHVVFYAFDYIDDVYRPVPDDGERSTTNTDGLSYQADSAMFVDSHDLIWAVALVVADEVTDFRSQQDAFDAPASGGAADGLTPTALPVAVPVLAFDQDPSTVTTACLTGAGPLDAMTWVTGCTETITPLDPRANPGQTDITLPPECPRCLQGAACLDDSDCDADLWCDDGSTCAPPP